MLKEGTIKLLDKDDKVKKTIAVSVCPSRLIQDTVIELTGAQLGLDNVDPAVQVNFKRHEGFFNPW